MTAVRHRDAALVALSLVPLVYTLFDTSDGDLPHYYRHAQTLLGGAVPYRDWVFEYPPYALVWLVLPGLLPGYTAFRACFSLQILALDIIAKVALLRQGRHLAPASGSTTLVPILVFSVLVAFQSYFYLKRLDAIAAALTLFGFVAFAHRRMAAAGALIGVAAGTKLYPGLVIPILFCAAWRLGKAKHFAAGTAAAVMPIVALSTFAPWWRFASFHAARGLQVESTYASLIWLAHFFGLTAAWTPRPAWLEIDGPTARALLPVARVLFVTATLGALAASTWAVSRQRMLVSSCNGIAMAFLARASLLPIVSFMAFGLVLSPQFAVWLIGPVAIAATAGPRAAVATGAVAVALTTFVFPAAGYFTPEGLSLGRTLVLVARNSALVVQFVLLGRELLFVRAAPALLRTPSV